MTQVSDVSRQYAVGSKQAAAAAAAAERARRRAARVDRAVPGRVGAADGRWADDPELLATFRAEVDERLASLSDGLLRARGAPVAAAARRRAVPRRAHRQGLGPHARARRRRRARAPRRGPARRAARRPVRTCAGTSSTCCSWPPRHRRARCPAPSARCPSRAAEVVAALDARADGTDPVTVPRLLRAGAEPGDVEPTTTSPMRRSGARAAPASRSGCPTRRVHDLLDVVGEADSTCAASTPTARRWSSSPPSSSCSSARCGRAAREAGSGRASPTPLTALVSLGDQLQAPARELRARSEDAAAGWPGSATARWGWRWCRCAGSSPASPRSCARSPPPPARTSRLVTRRRRRRARRARARRRRRRAAPPRHQRRRPWLRERRRPASRPASRARRRSPSSARQAGSTVVLEVSDDGRGIDEARAARAADRARAARRRLDRDRRPRCSACCSTPASPPATTSPRPRVAVSASTWSAPPSRTSAAPSRSSSELGAGTRFVLTLPVTLGVLRCLLAAGRRRALRRAAARRRRDRGAGRQPGARASPACQRPRTPGRDACRSPTSAQVLGVAGERDPARRSSCCSGAAGRDRSPGPSTRSRASGSSSSSTLGDFLGRLPGVAGATIDGDGSSCCSSTCATSPHRSPTPLRTSAVARPAPPPPHRTGTSRRARGRRPAAGSRRAGHAGRPHAGGRGLGRGARAAARDPRGRRATTS